MCRVVSLSAVGGRPHGRVLLGATVAALLAHGFLLSGLSWAWPDADVAPASRSVMRVRAVAAVERVPEIVAPRKDLDAGTTPAPAPASRPALTRTTARARVDAQEPRRPPAQRRAVPAVASLTSTALQAGVSASPTSADPSALRTADPATTSADAGPATTFPSDADAPPIYPTRLPPATTLRFRLERSGASGTGELTWAPQGQRYALRFEARLDGANALAQSSEGAIDAAGVAPLRFVERRWRHAAAAVNFRRDTGRIAFSGKAADAPLHAGSQDRLSWMLQLAAIVAADPDLQRGGARVLINVASASGDVAVWAFRCTGEAVLEAATGTAGTLAFVREPPGPYDVRAAVWLDPARGFLPARAAWSAGLTDAGFDLRVEPGPGSADVEPP